MNVVSSDHTLLGCEAFSRGEEEGHNSRRGEHSSNFRRNITFLMVGLVITTLAMGAVE